MKHILYLLCAVLFVVVDVLLLTAQTNKSIVGKWSIESIKQVDAQDPMSKELMTLLVGEDSYRHFFVNNLYTSKDHGKKTFGRWKMIENRKIVLTSYNGQIKTYEISKIANDTLILVAQKKMYITLVKTEDASENPEEEPPQNVEPVKATVQQISHRWVLKDTRHVAELTKEEELAGDLVGSALRGTWFDFKSDGLVLSRITSLKKAKWHFENKNKSIVIMDDNGEGSLWNIISISSSELILQKPHANMQVVYGIGAPIPYTGKNDPLLAALDDPDNNVVYSVTDIAPQFPGGVAKMNEWIKKNINIPKGEKITAQYLDVSAIVDITGEVIRPKIIKSVNKELDEEVLRLLKTMPLWKPAYNKSKLVRASVLIRVPLGD